ncbi:MAG: DNA-3-methyladenine glycosylase 2 family protein [Actinomycetota bacterium]|nr:DNA-3-methyladenine glycosylase 2 family protein [Actinomycetota bacterium]
MTLSRDRVWDAGRAVDVGATLAPLRRSTGDPAHLHDAAGVFWWACSTPDGDGTLALRAVRGVVTARAWGSGAQWLLDRIPALLGEGDDWSALDLSSQPRLCDVAHARPGLRLPATGLVMDSLVPAVLEQRVTGREAWRAWRLLLRRFGRPAPGPVVDLRVPPSARALLDVPGWDWHRMGVDSQRQRAIRAAAGVAGRLEECATMEPAAGLARLRILPGIGEWTAAETMQRAVGHPDAVSVGDYHIKDLVVHFLTGRPRGDDAEMVRLLEPWAGQRQRVVRLIELSGVGKPRFGPRLSTIDIRAI